MIWSGRSLISLIILLVRMRIKGIFLGGLMRLMRLMGWMRSYDDIFASVILGIFARENDFASIFLVITFNFYLALLKYFNKLNTF